MRKFLFVVMCLFLVFPVQGLAATEDRTNSQVEKIMELTSVSRDVLKEQIKEAAKSLNITEEEAAKAIYEELLIQQKLSYEEEKMMIQGGGGGTYTLGSSAKGNIFYETAATAGIEHGHIGIYYSSDTIVESMPSTGVRRLARTSKQVASGARIQAVTNITSTQKSNAANWANSRVGLDSYSYNFFNNRNTSCIGDKNCSKLVWCAFNLQANLDLDANGGLGVYPKDIRDHSRVTTLVYY